jgi:hypothetical protein
MQGASGMKQRGMREVHRLLALAVMAFVLIGCLPPALDAASPHHHRHIAYVHARDSIQQRGHRCGPQAAHVATGVTSTATRIAYRALNLSRGLIAGTCSAPQQGRSPPQARLIA